MPRLIGSLLPGRRRGGPADQGAVAALVGVLLAGGVLLGMAAYSVDLAVLYGERGQVLNAANAAAMAAAQECVRPVDRRGQSRCGSIPANRRFAAANAADNAMTIDQLCGPTIRPCASTAGSATRCVTAPPANLSYAEVHAGTLTADNKTVLPPVFAGAAVPGYTGTHVSACGRVAWGPPKGPYAALTVSWDVFNDVTNGGVNNAAAFQPVPPFMPSGSVEVVIKLQNAQSLRSGDDGGLGYLDADPNTCLVSNNVQSHADLDGWTNNAGNTMLPPSRCHDLIKTAEQANSDPSYLLMPIYSGVNTRADGRAQFRDLYGIAAFRVTGDKLSDDDGSDVILRRLDQGQFCGNNTVRADRCIRGYFVWANIIDGRFPAGGWPRTLAVATYKTVG